MLEIKTEIESQVARLFLVGELDIATVEDFKCKVENIRGQINSIIINFEQLEFLDSTGVGSLIQIIHMLDSEHVNVQVINISDAVFEVLDLLGVPELLGEEKFIRVTKIN